MTNPSGKTRYNASKAVPGVDFDGPIPPSGKPTLAKPAVLTSQLSGELRDRLVAYHLRHGLPGTRAQDTIKALLEAALGAPWCASSFVQNARQMAYRQTMRSVRGAFADNLDVFGKQMSTMLEEAARQARDTELDTGGSQE